MSDEKTTEVRVEVVGTTWEDGDALAESGGEWLKIEPDQKVLLNITAAPVSAWKTFPSEPDKRKKAWSFVVFLPGSGLRGWDVTSKRLFQTLKRKVSERGTAAIFAVTRLGTGLETTYDVEFQRDLDDAELADCAEMLKAARDKEDGSLPF